MTAHAGALTAMVSMAGLKGVRGAVTSLVMAGKRAAGLAIGAIAVARAMAASIAAATVVASAAEGLVTCSTPSLVAAAGADVLVAGSAVFKGGSVGNPAPYGVNIRAIREAAEAAQ